MKNLKSTNNILTRLILSAILIMFVFLLFLQAGAFSNNKKISENMQEAKLIYAQAGFTPKLITLPDLSQNAINKNKKILALQKEYNNKDIIGFLTIDGTVIDYPVLQSSDNDFYLYRDMKKEYSNAGSIFMDYENNVLKKDKNTIVYGHNMNRNIMFHSLRFYKDIDFYKDHKYITLSTLYGDYTWEIFSFYKTDVNFYYIQVLFDNDDEFYDLAKEMKNRSLYDTGVKITKDDRILTLSTCTNETDDTRYVVNAKLIKDTNLLQSIHK